MDYWSRTWRTRSIDCDASGVLGVVEGVGVRKPGGPMILRYRRELED